jgi:hypothetical protein
MVWNTHCGWCLIHLCRHIQAARNAEEERPLEAPVEETTFIEIMIAVWTCETSMLSKYSTTLVRRKGSRPKSGSAQRPDRRAFLPYFPVRAHKSRNFLNLSPSIRTG